MNFACSIKSSLCSKLPGKREDVAALAKPKSYQSCFATFTRKEVCAALPHAPFVRGKIPQLVSRILRFWVVPASLVGVPYG